MANLSFNSKFWDYELGNFQSYEGLLKKIKEEQKATKEYLEFVKQRVLAEELHGKALAKLGKTSGVKNEIGILSGAWKNCHLLCGDLESLITASASKLNAEIEHTLELLNKQVEQRKKEDDEVREAQQTLKSAIHKLQTKQKHHQAKTKDLEKARQVLRDQFKDSASKDSAKAASNLQKAEQSWESACSSLNQAETQLEDVRNTWEFKTEQALETLQALQEQRLNAMSNFQIVLVATVKDEMTYGLKVLEKWATFDESDVENEINGFIQRHGNSNKRPSVIPLTSFDATDTSVNTPDRTSKNAPSLQSNSSFGSGDSTEKLSTLKKFKRILPTPPKPPKFMGLAERAPVVEPVESAEYATLEWAHAQQAKKEAIAKPPRGKQPICLPRSPFAKSSSDDDDDDDDEFKEPEVAYAEVVKGPVKAKRHLGGYSFGGGAAAGGASSMAEEPTVDEEELSGAGAYVSGNQMMRVLYDYDAKHTTDIGLKEGELVKIIENVSDEWVEVKSSRGKIGHFPRNYLEPADS